MKPIWFGRISRLQLGRAAPNPLINQFASVAALYSFFIRVNYHFNLGFPATCTPKEVNALTASFWTPHLLRNELAGSIKEGGKIQINNVASTTYLPTTTSFRSFFLMNSTFYSPFPPLIFFFSFLKQCFSKYTFLT